MRKLHTSSPSAFGSPTAGPLGDVTEGMVRIYFKPLRLPRLPDFPAINAIRNNIFFAAVTLDDPGFWLPIAGDNGVEGIVVATLGGGHVPEWLADDLAEVARRKPVVLCSRTGAGRVLQSTYGIKGGEVDAISRGLIHGGLDGFKARVLLTLLLSAGVALDEIRIAFSAYTNFLYK